MKNLFSLFLVMVAHLAFASGSDSVRVYIFFSETCPICQSVTLSLKEVFAKFEDKGVEFIAVFPNTTVSTQKSISDFKKKYKMPFQHVIDEEQKLTAQFAATITPEVIVVNSKNNAVLYRGKIDNSFESIGKRRRVITEQYLEDALSAITQQQSISIQQTKPVGCFIIKQNQ